MPRYAYIPFNANYIEKLPNVEEDYFRDYKVFRVDSTTITDSECSIIKKELRGFFCYSCDSKMKFRNQKNRHNHFAHISKKECFEAESLAHASVKKDLYNRFKNRGYKVAMERTFKSGIKKVRTDVAVIEMSDILAIEVQASPSIKRSTIAERTNAYANEAIPTAWVIVLDSFFGKGNFTSTKESVLVKNEDGTSSYVERLLPYSVSTPFVITVDVPKSFYFILDIYKYVVAVSHDGHFFMIRRTDIIGDNLEIFRVQQEKVVDTLLATELISIDYIPESKVNNKPLDELEHRDGLHLDDNIELEGERLLKEFGIDFNKAYEEEIEQLKSDEPLDILLVIEETKRREKLNSKKIQLLNQLDKQIIELREQFYTIQAIYVEMEDRLEELAIRIEMERMEQEQTRKLQEHYKEQKPVKELLLTQVEKSFKEKSLGQLTTFSTVNFPYITEPLFTYVIDRLKRDIREVLDNDMDIDLEALEIGLLLNKVIMEKKKKIEEQKQQLKEEQEKKESLRKLVENKRNEEQLSFENEQKEKLCDEINKMQSDLGTTIVRDINKLKQKNLKEVKEIHRSVLNQYERMSQMSLF
ncbi:competence protein CoiA family protein [Bacillus alkalisoli]|uniref:competence protein CoiA family protein n=1 Tax=Bacillus alkalisoli TaxID=2011008 RepID=UPI000C2438F2|nr:competence protein CoiA family protein [Bacillus alkalisoli]